jgi:S1-C subfamily serine protease
VTILPTFFPRLPPSVRDVCRLIRSAWVALLGVVALSCAGSASQPPTVEVVQVRVSGCSTADYLAVGVRAQGGRVVTVAHTLRGATAVTVGGRSASVVALDHRRDLAVLLIAGDSQGASAFARPQLGPASLRRIDDGGAAEALNVEVTNIGAIDMDEPVDKTVHRRAGVTFVAGAPIAKGNSGAPLVDKGGRIIGILFATDLDSGPNAYAVAASEIESLLDEAGATPVPTGKCS